MSLREGNFWYGWFSSLLGDVILLRTAWEASWESIIPFKELSPKKSTEGCIGGIIGTAILGLIFGILYVKRFMPVQYIEWKIALICGVGALMGMVGDLAASGIKRNNNIKDFGHLIPGHGGIMDRFDSMILCGPAAYILTYLLVAAS